MDDDLEPVLVRVRGDSAAFARDVAAMRGELDDVLGVGAERAALRLESALLRAVKTGTFGFEELKGVALSALDAIAGAALKAGMGSLFGASGGGLGDALAGLVGGLPGRATGGPVSPGRAYVVGERGPELFVPSSSGRVEAGGAGGVREVRVAITVNAAAGAAPGVLAQSGRQVARAVRAALAVE
ncbi:tail tape measure protein [Sphingomonas sp. CFBP 13714]|uniref:tail tape measure protein n=1 Tax=Sphingomonas sp. CFBP 13714 TaxID=2775308 RepID=UPI00177C85C7|nr:tail tape measure protein [Sphingomonas sp. CFBP 13714]MBD8698852.1 tail tape measure protein [Sphingomonas sp. CFBP 13714]